MISVDEALALIDAYRPVWGEETISLSAANGRILAQDIIAPMHFPAHSISIMDGYALRKIDRKGHLRLIGESRAGVPFESQIRTGETVRIFTGAIVPNGADQVEIQENAILNDSIVSFQSHTSNQTYIRPAGADFKAGDILSRKNERVTPAMILALATCNFNNINVKKRPSVALLSSGDELQPLGSDLKRGEIIDVITPALTAHLNQWGIQVENLGIANDNPKSIRDKLESCTANIIVPIGAASVGDYDFMKSTALDLGFTPIFSKVAMKPGKPSWFSKRGNQALLGLPGNPSSAWVASQIFLYYLIFESLNWKRAKLAEPLPDNGPRENHIRARILPNGKVMPLMQQDSGLVTPLYKADCVLRHMANSDGLKENESIQILHI